MPVEVCHDVRNWQNRAGAELRKMASVGGIQNFLFENILGSDPIIEVSHFLQVSW